MKSKLPALVLIASLLLNVFFCGSYWLSRQKASGLTNRGSRIEAAADSLRLTSDQKNLFRRLKKEAQALRKDYRARKKDLQGDLWKVLVGDLVGEEEGQHNFTPLIHEMALSREQYQQKIAALIHRFLAELDNEQKNRFLEISTGNRALNALLSGR